MVLLILTHFLTMLNYSSHGAINNYIITFVIIHFTLYICFIKINNNYYYYTFSLEAFILVIINSWKLQFIINGCRNMVEQLLPLLQICGKGFQAWGNNNAFYDFVSSIALNATIAEKVQTWALPISKVKWSPTLDHTTSARPVDNGYR